MIHLLSDISNVHKWLEILKWLELKAKLVLLKDKNVFSRPFNSVVLLIWVGDNFKTVNTTS